METLSTSVLIFLDDYYQENNAESDGINVRDVYRVPTQTGNLEKWEGIFQSGKSQGILNRLEKSGKTTQNTGKLR